MRKLCVLALTCLSIAVMAQSNWRTNPSYGSIYDSWYDIDQVYNEDGYYPEGKHLYPPNLWVKESKKFRKKKRKARKKRHQFPSTNMAVITDRKNMSITVSLSGDNKESLHLKLIDGRGLAVQSYLHLSPTSIKEFKMLDQKPGKYTLKLYAGIERRLLSSYDVKRY